MIGELLGHYRIDARLGSGGMGVVYRARDELLQRTVALKLVAGDRLGSTPEDHAHLLEEARAASCLSHRNICTVYEVGEAGDRTYIAMEYVDGEPLARSIPHDGLPAETVVRYGIQVADALSHAHERGVIHRDLKTANIAITAQGDAKVLDFGLAHRIEPRGSDTATHSVEVGTSGTLAGTLPYIAPELLLGRSADARSDIWALGVVLYEAATGELPFKGRNEFDLTAAILRAPPAPLPAHVPPMLRAVIGHCLAKEPGQRYQHAGEVRAALEAMQSDVTAVPSVAAGTSSTKWAAIALAALVVLSAAAWLLLRDRGSAWERMARDAQLTRVVSSDDRTFDPAVSPDGRMLCYAVEAPNGRVDLYAARISGGARIRLTDDDALESAPKFSPDGERIAFARRAGRQAAPEIRIVPALGGDVLATIPAAAYPAWSSDGQRLAYIRRAERGDSAELAVSRADGSDARAILRGDGVYPFLRDAAWSPDGRTVAVVRSTGGVAGEIWLVSSGGGAPRRVLDEPASVFSASPSFTSDGRGIIHSSNRGGATNIWLLPLDGARPIRLTTGAGPDESPTLAADGTIAFVNSRWRNLLEIHDLAHGSARTLVTHASYLWAPAFSPDGQEIAFSRSEVDGSWHVWIASVDNGSVRQVTSSPSGELYPRWSPDGAYVLFHTWAPPHRIGRIAREGGVPSLFSFATRGEGDAFADMSPDGRTIAFTRSETETERVYTASAAGGQPRLLTSVPATTPRWSPDGSRIVFAANRGYAGGIFVVDAKGGEPRRIANEGGWPNWWPDGRQVAYLAVGARDNQEIRIVSLDGGTPRTLSAVKLSGTNHPFAVSPDGATIAVSNASHLGDEIWLLRRAPS